VNEVQGDDNDEQVNLDQINVSLAKHDEKVQDND